MRNSLGCAKASWQCPHLYGLHGIREQRWLLRSDRCAKVVLHWPHLNSPPSAMLSNTSSIFFPLRVPSPSFVTNFLCCTCAWGDFPSVSLWTRELLLSVFSCSAGHLLFCRCDKGAEQSSGIPWRSRVNTVCVDDLLFCPRCIRDEFDALLFSTLSSTWESPDCSLSCDARTDIGCLFPISKK